MSNKITSNCADELALNWRRAMRMVPASVFVVAAKTEDGKKGAVTATAFSGVSMEPPSILVCLHREGRFSSIIENADMFSVNLLTTDHHEVAKVCASHHVLETRVAGEGWVHPEDGPPRLENSLVSFVCRKSHFTDYGSHRIHIGEVHHVHFSDNLDKALLYSEGEYVELLPTHEQVDASILKDQS